MNLYNISSDYMRLLDDIAEGNIPPEAVKDTLEAVEGELTDKIDNIACYIKSVKASAAAIKAEAEALTARAKTKQNEADRLIDFIMTAMQMTGKSKIETVRCKISIRQNPEAVQIQDAETFTRWAAENDDSLLTYQAPAINKNAVKQALQAGIKLPGCELTRTERVEIK